MSQIGEVWVLKLAEKVGRRIVPLQNAGGIVTIMAGTQLC
jgi:hypothetical protein